MRHTPLGWSAVLATTLLAVAAGTALPVASASATAGRCPAGDGVTVVVDPGPLGGGTRLGCDPDGGGRPGIQVVQNAGFSLSYVVTQPGFVCRIDGAPGPETCQRTPPQDAYWALFWSDGRSSRWTYATAGIGSLDVPDGGSIGWRFQDGGARDEPGAAPTPSGSGSPTPTPTPRPPKPTPSPKPSQAPKPKPTRPAPTASPRPTASPGGASSTPTPTPSQQERSGRGGNGEGTAKPGGGRRHVHDAAKPHRNQSKEHRPTADRAARSDASVTRGDAVTESTRPLKATSQPDSGGPALVLVAAAAIVALAGAAGVIAWRRRS